MGVDGRMAKVEIVAYEVFSFGGSNFYCSDCFKKHPDSKDWIEKVYSQKDLVEKSSVFCCKCEKELGSMAT